MEQSCQDVTNVKKGTCAVSRYKFDRSQKTVTVQGLYCEQVRVSGYKIQQDLSEGHRFAKTVTSLLTLPSVLGFRANFKIVRIPEIYQLGNNPVLKFDINSSFRPVSHRLTNDVNSTMSGRYIEIIGFSVLHIKAIKYCSHLKL